MDFEVLWIVAILVFAGVEAYTSVLVSIWFAAGSAASLVATLLGAGIYTQIIIFLAVSLLSMFLLRRAALKSIKNNAESTNLDRIIGQSIVIDAEVDNRKNTGTATIGDVVWKVHNSFFQINTLCNSVNKWHFNMKTNRPGCIVTAKSFDNVGMSLRDNLNT